MGVSTNFGANMNRRKATNSVDVNVMVDVRMERGNKGSGIGFKIGNTGEKTEEVPFYVLFLWDPIFFSAIVDNYVLMWVAVNGEGAGRSVEEIREKVNYRYL